MGMPGPTELIIILGIVVLLFGSKKIPELMGGMAKGIKSWKEGMAGVEKDLNDIKREINKPV